MEWTILTKPWRQIMKAFLMRHFTSAMRRRKKKIGKSRAPLADPLVFGMLGRGVGPGLNKEGPLKLQCQNQLAMAIPMFGPKRFAGALPTQLKLTIWSGGT